MVEVLRKEQSYSEIKNSGVICFFCLLSKYKP